MVGHLTNIYCPTVGHLIENLVKKSNAPLMPDPPPPPLELNIDMHIINKRLKAACGQRFSNIPSESQGGPSYELCLILKTYLNPLIIDLFLSKIFLIFYTSRSHHTTITLHEVSQSIDNRLRPRFLPVSDHLYFVKRHIE